MKKISIIILNWNTADTTLDCLRGLNQYLGHLHPEIIVVDNASTDDSVLKITKLKNIKLIINHKNLGFSKGSNIGAKKATGDYLLFLNSDIKLIDQSLTKMLEYLISHPEIGLIGPRFLNPDLSPQASVFPPQTPLSAFRQYWLGQKSYSKYTPKKLSYPWAISGGTILISKKIFNQIGGWDERYFFYYEDLELCRQIKKIGLKICYFPQARVVHHHGASGKNLKSPQDQWRRLIPSSKIYHGPLRHYLLFFITWTRRQWQKLTGY